MRNDIAFIDPFAGIGGFRLGLEGINGSENRRSKEVAKTTSKVRSGLVSKTRKENGSPQRQSGGRLDERVDQRAFACQISTNPQQGLGNKKKQSVSRTQRGRRRKLQEFYCVWSNEWDKYCAKIYEKNFGEAPDTRDIRTVPSGEIPDHDLLCAGFPCQSFSIAGKRAGFEDTRGTLFFEIARILRDKRPRHLLLENVKGLLSHQQGKTFQTILGVLADLGYRCEWQVLNSKNFGVPQNRERVFIVGHLGGEGGSQVFPIGEGDGISKEENGEASSRNEVATSLTQDYHKAPLNRGETYLKYIGAIMTEKNKKRLENGKDFSRNFPQGQRVYSTEGIGTTLASQAGGLEAKTGLYFDSLHGFGHGWQGYHNRKALRKGLIRRLTPIECERLQGFPDGWTKGVSDTQRYKMLGNAVTVNVVEAIGRQLKEAINA